MSHEAAEQPKREPVVMRRDALSNDQHAAGVANDA